MQEEYNKLLKSFEEAIENKEKGKFGKEDVNHIYTAASKLFDGSINLDQVQIDQISEKWVQLTEGKIDKNKAKKKLQGTSRADAIHSVLLSIL